MFSCNGYEDLKAIDFESARRKGDPIDCSADQVIGTVSYMSPELMVAVVNHLSGADSSPIVASPSMDVWSICVIIMEIFLYPETFWTIQNIYEDDKIRSKLISITQEEVNAIIQSSFSSRGMRDVKMFLLEEMKVRPPRRSVGVLKQCHALLSGSSSITRSSLVDDIKQALSNEMSGIRCSQELTLDQLSALGEEMRECRGHLDSFSLNFLSTAARLDRLALSTEELSISISSRFDNALTIDDISAVCEASMKQIESCIRTAMETRVDDALDSKISVCQARCEEMHARQQDALTRWARMRDDEQNAARIELTNFVRDIAADVKLILDDTASVSAVMNAIRSEIHQTLMLQTDLVDEQRAIRGIVDQVMRDVALASGNCMGLTQAQQSDSLNQDRLMPRIMEVLETIRSDVVSSRRSIDDLITIGRNQYKLVSSLEAAVNQVPNLFIFLPDTSDTSSNLGGLSGKLASGMYKALNKGYSLFWKRTRMYPVCAYSLEVSERFYVIELSTALMRTLLPLLSISIGLLKVLAASATGIPPGLLPNIPLDHGPHFISNVMDKLSREISKINMKAVVKDIVVDEAKDMVKDLKGSAKVFAPAPGSGGSVILGGDCSALRLAVDEVLFYLYAEEHKVSVEEAKHRSIPSAWTPTQTGLVCVSPSADSGGGGSLWVKPEYRERYEREGRPLHTLV